MNWLASRSIAWLKLIKIQIIFVKKQLTSTSQSDIIDSNSKDISSLLQTLIEKEKEINELNQKLENCKKVKKYEELIK